MKSLWILCDEGKVGTYRQCLALATWLETEYNFTVSYKSVNLGWPYKWLPPQAMVKFKNPSKIQELKAESLTPPYPDIVIAGGRQAVNAALTLRHNCRTIILQNPRLNPKYFDLVIPPYHDQVVGQNVFSTIGAIHPIRPQQLEALRNQFYQGLTLTVVIGGDSKHYKYTSEYIQILGNTLRSLVTQEGPLQWAKLLITPSRRSRAELIQQLEQTLQGLTYELWDNQGENPYLRYLACADAIIVTGDSISMMSEACITGKPVYIYEVSTQNKRVRHFVKALYSCQSASPLIQITDMTKTFKRLDELERLKPFVKRFLDE